MDEEALADIFITGALFFLNLSELQLNKRILIF